MEIYYSSSWKCLLVTWACYIYCEFIYQSVADSVVQACRFENVRRAGKYSCKISERSDHTHTPQSFKESDFLLDNCIVISNVQVLFSLKKTKILMKYVCYNGACAVLVTCTIETS